MIDPIEIWLAKFKRTPEGRIAINQIAYWLYNQGHKEACKDLDGLLSEKSDIHYY